jgi:hypothetical protein
LKNAFSTAGSLSRISPGRGRRLGRQTVFTQGVEDEVDATVDTEAFLNTLLGDAA